MTCTLYIAVVESDIEIEIEIYFFSTVHIHKSLRTREFWQFSNWLPVTTSSLGVPTLALVQELHRGPSS